jgi:flavodoxin
MKILVVYESRMGNTERVALRIAETLRGFGSVDILNTKNDALIDPAGFDLIVAGSPDWLHGPIPGVRRFLASLEPGSLHGIGAAAFDTQYEDRELVPTTAASVTERGLHQAGASMLVAPAHFLVWRATKTLVPGEEESAEKWAILVGKLATHRDEFLHRDDIHGKVAVAQPV